jgi:tetratricopeptide (TPR) repeat protein
LVGSRACDNFPTNASAARLTSIALSASGRWREAMRYETAWRERSPGERLAADLAIADAQLNLGQPKLAAAQLEPYIRGLTPNADVPQDVALITEFATAQLLSGHKEAATALLEPLMNKRREWCIAWGRCAVAHLDRDEAVKWMERVTVLCSEGSDDQQIAVATLWADLSGRWRDTTYLTKGRDLLKGLAQSEKVSPKVLTTLGGLEEQNKDEVAAERFYRQAVSRDDRDLVALNNLAMLLLRRGADLNEALALAKRAVTLQPIADTYDTLARVQLELKDMDHALLNMRNSVKLDPANPVRQIDLADLLQKCQHTDEAKTVLDNAEAASNLIARNPEARAHLRETRRRLSVKNPSALVN